MRDSRKFGAAIVAIALSIWMAPMVLSQDRPLFRALVEIAPEDELTVTPEEAVKACSELLSRREKASVEDTCAALKLRASAYARLLNKDAALADAEALCKLRPMDSEARFLRGLVRAQCDDFSGAQSDIGEAIRLNPRVADYHAYLGAVLYRSGKRRDGLATARGALKIDSESPAALYLAGLLSLSCSENRACIEHLNKYLELRPFGNAREPERAYNTRGMALMHLNRPRQALDNALIAKRLNPQSHAALILIVFVYIDLGKYHAAARASDDLVKLKPPNAADMFMRGELYARIGDKVAAEASIRSARAAASETSPGAEVAASCAYYELGDYPKCAECLEAALKRKPNYTAAVVRRAVLQSTCPDVKFRDGPAALKVLETVDAPEFDNGDWDGEWVRVMARLADARAECGHFEKAVELTRKVLAMLGPDRDHREQEQRLKLFEFEKTIPAHRIGEIGIGDAVARSFRARLDVHWRIRRS